MSAKYSGLPDIDSAPDVFETPDEPETVQTSEEFDKAIPPSSTDIDRSELPPRKREIAHESNDAPPKETHLARLRRLQAEVRELESELGQSSTTSRPSVLSRQPVDIVGELSTLRDKLSLASNSVDVKQTPGDVPRLNTSVAGTTPAPAPAPSTSDSDLDKRLASLERLVGSTAEQDSSLSDSISRLDHLVSILTQPRHLDSISRRVKLLLADLDRASTASRRGPAQSPPETTTTLQTAEYEQLQSLFTLLPRLDPLLPIIPPLLVRLKSLSTLHAEALGIAQELREIQSADGGVGEQEAELRAVVEGVKQGMGEAAGLIAGNWESLQARIGELDERVKRL